MIDLDEKTVQDFMERVSEYQAANTRERLHEDLDEIFERWVKNAEEFFSMASNAEVFERPDLMEQDAEVAERLYQSYNFFLLAEMVTIFGADAKDMVYFVKIINIAFAASYIRLIAKLAKNVENSKKRRAHNGNKSFGPSAGKSYENRDNN
jgi:hypothetical protein